MKELFKTNPTLEKLSQHCTKLTKIFDPTIISPSLAKKTSLKDNSVVSNLGLNRAAKIIQRTWHLSQARDALRKNSYQFYLSLVGPNEPQRQMSLQMFGRHVAELSVNGREKIDNPFLNSTLSYHREDENMGKMFENLLIEFSITPEELHSYVFIPISCLKNLEIEQVIQEHLAAFEEMIKLIKQPHCSIILVAIPKKENEALKMIRQVFRSTGLIATLWEIAENIKQSPVEVVETKTPLILSHLPQTTEQLLNGPIFKRLLRVSNNTRYPTHQLAECLCKLLRNLPLMSSEAIQRIGLMLEITHTFYEYHYAQYAFCVYAVVHEISLALAKPEHPDSFEPYFVSFYDEAKSSFFDFLNLDEAETEHNTFVALPAISGTNAYAMAMELAYQSRTWSGKPPVLQVVAPSYYEFDYITRTNSVSEPDIYIISAGPMVNKQGLEPGIDINQFIKRKIIAPGCLKPIIIVIDTTTALYKNLKLDVEVKSLIRQGMLSLLIHESHQKFGLLHTDQAQYGRVLALCSKQSFSETVLTRVQKNAKDDFNHHVDMRIGAFLNSACGPSLEKIKELHFRNGAIWGSSPQIVSHEDEQTNPDEYYFFCASLFAFKVAIADIFESRDSFGHYTTTVGVVEGVARLSPDASDWIDTLLQTMQVLLRLEGFSLDELKETVIAHPQREDNLSLQEQIICLAILNNIVGLPPAILPEFNFQTREIKIKLDSLWSELPLEIQIEHKRKIEENRWNEKKNSILLPIAMEQLIKQCSNLWGRQFSIRVTQYIAQLYRECIDENQIAHGQDFIAACRVLYCYDLQLTRELFSQLSTNALLCKNIKKANSVNAAKLLFESDLAEKISLERAMKHTFFTPSKPPTHPRYMQPTISSHIKENSHRKQ